MPSRHLSPHPNNSLRFSDRAAWHICESRPFAEQPKTAVALTTGARSQRRALALVAHGSCCVLTVEFYDFVIVPGQKLESILL
jgi:hypothetical protein